MTRYEYLKSLSIEEIAELIKFRLGTKTCKEKHCPYYSEIKGYCTNYKPTHCTQATVNWLNSEIPIVN